MSLMYDYDVDRFHLVRSSSVIIVFSSVSSTTKWRRRPYTSTWSVQNTIHYKTMNSVCTRLEESNSKSAKYMYEAFPSIDLILRTTTGWRILRHFSHYFIKINQSIIFSKLNFCQPVDSGRGLAANSSCQSPWHVCVHATTRFSAWQSKNENGN